jgi:DNA-binding MarR family transcriptional regulator
MKVEPRTSNGIQLFSLLGTTYNAMLRARKKELEPLGISLRQSSVLWGLQMVGRPMTVAEMSQIVDRDHQTTSQLLKRMEKAGLVERHKGPHKRSTITVVLTPKGEKVFNQAFDKYEVHDEIVSCLSAEEQDNLRAYLAKLREKAIARSALYPTLPSPLASILGLDQ